MIKLMISSPTPPPSKPLAAIHPQPVPSVGMPDEDFPGHFLLLEVGMFHHFWPFLGNVP